MSVRQHMEGSEQISPRDTLVAGMFHNQVANAACFLKCQNQVLQENNTMPSYP